jgi:hypothetical protein
LRYLVFLSERHGSPAGALRDGTVRPHVRIHFRNYLSPSRQDRKEENRLSPFFLRGLCAFARNILSDPNEKHQDLPCLGGNILDAFVGFSGVFSPQYSAIGLKSRSL